MFKGYVAATADYICLLRRPDDRAAMRADIFNASILIRYASPRTPKSKMLIYLGRFLGKIALEYWYMEFKDNVFNSKFDEIRKYVRYGTTKHIWPILHGKLDDNLLIFHPKNEFEEERTLYAYRFYEIDGQVLFCFDIGMERYSIILSEKYPNGEIFTDKFLSALCKGTNGLPNILYYIL